MNLAIGSICLKRPPHFFLFLKTPSMWGAKYIWVTHHCDKGGSPEAYQLIGKPLAWWLTSSLQEQICKGRILRIFCSTFLWERKKWSRREIRGEERERDRDRVSQWDKKHKSRIKIWEEEKNGKHEIWKSNDPVLSRIRKRGITLFKKKYIKI